MEVMCNNYMPGDTRLVERLVSELKSQGIFDQFRKECISDVDTKPAYQNLRQRVEGTVTTFLNQQIWSTDLNKNQLREQLRKNLHESGFLETGVERIVDQVVNPKISTVFLPKVEDVVYRFLGMEKPATRTLKKEEKPVSITDLLPTDLEAVSPESNESFKREKKEESLIESLPSSEKMEEDESPPFEPLVGQKGEENSMTADKTQMDENSKDSHLSGFSGLQSHESQQGSDTKNYQMDLLNQDSQNSSETHLSIITSEDATKMEICEDSNAESKEKTEIKADEVDSVKQSERAFNFKEDSDNTSEKVDEKIEEKPDDKKEKKHEKSEDKKAKSSEKSRDKKDDKHKRSSSSKDKERSSSKHSSHKDSKDRRDSKSSSTRRDKEKDKERSKDRSEKDKSSKYKEKSDKDKERSEKDRDKSKEKKVEKSKSEKEIANKDEKEKDRIKSDKSKNEKDKSGKDKDRHKSDKEKSSREKDKYKSKEKDKNDRDKPKEKPDKDKDKSSKDKSSKEKESGSKEGKDRKENDQDKDRNKENDKGKDKNKTNSKHSSGKDKKRDSSSTSHSNNKEKSSSKEADKSKSLEKPKKEENKHTSSKKSSRDTKKKSKDDHYSSKNKKNDRRSTDRDSNDGTSNRNNYLTNYTESMSSRSENNNSQDYSNSSFSGGSGDSGNSDKVEAPEKENVNVEVANVMQPQPMKYMKPKFASNFEEARKLMKIRKQLSKLEKQNQLSLTSIINIEMPKENGLANDEKHQPEEDTILIIDDESDSINTHINQNSVEKDESASINLNNNQNRVEKGPNKLVIEGKNLTMENFEALEVKLAQVMAKINCNSYESDEDYEFKGYSLSDVDISPKQSKVSIDKDKLNAEMLLVDRQIKEAKESLLPPKDKKIEDDPPVELEETFEEKEDHVSSQTETLLTRDNVNEITILKTLTINLTRNEECLFLEKPGLVEDRNLKFLLLHIAKLQSEVEGCIETSKNNLCSLKRGRKRKHEDFVDLKNNNDAEYIQTAKKRRGSSSTIKPMSRANEKRLCNHTDIAPNEHFSLPLSPAESDKSIERKDEDLLIPMKQKRILRGYNQRYSSEDLYKPRPVFGKRTKFPRNTN